MRNILLGALIAVSTSGTLLATTDGTTRAEADGAIAISVGDEAAPFANPPLMWAACRWATGVYGPVRVCN